VNDNGANYDMRAQLVGALIDACGPSEEVRVLFDATAEGVRVPENLRNDGGGVWFAYSRRFPVPIPDLVVDTAGISATLSFGRVPCPTFVPWSAIKLVHVPPHVRQRAVDNLAADAVAELEAKAKTAARSRFRIVAEDEEPPEGDEPDLEHLGPHARAAWGPRLVKGGAA
jgi:hypothetical protein